MTKLDQWLKDTETKAAHFARAIGVSAPYIHDLRKGARRPSEKVAQRIAQETQNAVQPDDWAAS